MIEYGFTRELDTDFDSAMETLKESLKEEGFGVLTAIDVKEKLHEHLGVDYKKYVILGVCDPVNAYKALLAEETSGLMWPWNVILYESDGKTTVAVSRPSVIMQITGNLDLRRIAKDIERRLKCVLDALQPAAVAR